MLLNLSGPGTGCPDIFPGQTHVLARVAITEYHRLCGLNNRNLFFIVLEVGKSKIKVPADSVPGENPLPGLQMAIFSLSSHDQERSSLSCLFFIRRLIAFVRVPPSCPNYLPKAPPPNIITLGIRASTYEFGAGGHIQSIAACVPIN